MRTITINKRELLERIKDNRRKHKAIFLDACDGYRAKVIEVLEQRLDEIKNGKTVTIAIVMPVPEDHTRDYDRVVDMLEMHHGDFVEVTEQEFAQYARDDWAWKRQFAQTINAGGYTEYMVEEEG